MLKKIQPTRWARIFAIVISLGLLGNVAFFLFISGKRNYSEPPPAAASTAGVISIEMISLTPVTATPFQPLPTATNTPTITPTATATATNTPKPTRTPVPPTATVFILHPVIDGIPEAAQVDGVYGHNQSHLLSCESRSAADWAAYFGVTISENTFQNKLPSSDDPDAGFVGSPDGAEGQLPPNSYGVHADPVAALLNDYGLNAKAVHSFSFDDLRRQIAAGHPVIVWVYGNVWSGGTPVNYTASDGNTTRVVAFEHTVIVTGYDSNYVMILDGAIAYPRAISVFKNSWSTLGNMAVILQ